MVTRKNLPEQQEFVDYMREQTTATILAEKTELKKTTVEHWFRRDKAGFSHPSVEDWEKIKPHLTTVKYDKEMTTLHSIEWKTDMKMWRTPDAHCDRGASSKERMEMKLEKGMPISLNDQVAHPNLMWPTPTQDSATERTKKYSQGGKPLTLAVQEAQQMWPTPTQRDYKGQNSLKHIQEKPRHNSQLPNRLRQQGISGSLNPTWVEWLMGYPEGYTDLKDWAILSSRKSSKK
jgi:hypothetical protein